MRSHFSNKYPDFRVSSNIYSGYMDLTYFHFFPKSLKPRKLKIVILFIHETFRFEVWLAGNNKKVQLKYLNLFTKSNWNKYHLASMTKGVDSILDHILIDNPDFRELDMLTKQIEQGTLKFLRDVETFLSKQET
ncbi:MAG: hypothetical protein HWN80_18970 [Candidatus Lokiarchaeota archaeon]|nr:hypothetical protein [Candidatus Lokiarchaeota archaeon]